MIIDDIVYPDGHTEMETLGGGSTYAVAGMRVWAQGVGIVAGVGWDFSKDHRDHLERMDIDLTGLLLRNYPTPRAWQVLEWDGRRTEIFRTDMEQFRQMLPSPTEVPVNYLAARGIHFFDFGDYAEVIKLRSHFENTVLLWEPYLPPTSEVTLECIKEALAHVDIFAPNYDEARRLCGTDHLEQIMNDILACGVAVVAIRMGVQGSIVRARGKKGAVRIPIYPAQAVDTIGAGNAYCGGLLVGYCETEDILAAGLYGTVAASFAVEQVGPPREASATRQEAQRRHSWLHNQAIAY
jgi:cytidine kinase